MGRLTNRRPASQVQGPQSDRGCRHRPRYRALEAALVFPGLLLWTRSLRAECVELEKLEVLRLVKTQSATSPSGEANFSENSRWEDTVFVVATDASDTIELKGTPVDGYTLVRG
jgi:hypothetical protein